MALQQVWKDVAAIGRESAFGTSPSGTLPYHLGGSYFMLPVEQHSLAGKIDKTNPASRTGYREANAYAPVVGTRRVEGTVQGDVFPDALGALLYAALGACNSTRTADAANPLNTEADISLGISPITNPTTSAFLQFVITSAAGSNMSLTIVGVTANGDTMTEVLPVTLSSGAATVYSRYSYDTITSITPAGFTAGALTLNGYVSAAHVFTLADTPVSYSIINKGDPGCSSSQQATYAKCVLRSLRLDADAGAGATRLTYNADWIGQYGTYATASTLYPSVDKPLAGWNMGVLRNGAAYYHIVRLTMQISTGNNVVWTADSSQDPRYAIGGQFAVTGQMTLVMEDGTDWNLFANNSESNFEITFSNPYDLLAAGTEKQVLFELTRLYFTNAQKQDYQAAQAIQADFTTVRDASDGALRVTLTNSVYAY